MILALSMSRLTCDHTTRSSDVSTHTRQLLALHSTFVNLHLNDSKSVPQINVPLPINLVGQTIERYAFHHPTCQHVTRPSAGAHNHAPAGAPGRIVFPYNIHMLEPIVRYNRSNTTHKNAYASSPLTRIRCAKTLRVEDVSLDNKHA